MVRWRGEKEAGDTVHSKNGLTLRHNNIPCSTLVVHFFKEVCVVVLYYGRFILVVNNCLS
jgi:hypothetical protein